MVPMAAEGTRFTDEHYLELGRLVVQWAQLESIQGHLLGLLAQAPGAAAHLIVDGLSARTVTGKCRWLIKHRLAGAEQETALAVLKDVDAARAARNQFIHGGWAERYDGQDWWPGVYGVKLGKSGELIWQDIRVEPADVEALWRRVADLKGRLVAICVLVDLPPPDNGGNQQSDVTLG